MGDSSAEVEWQCHFQKKCIYVPLMDDEDCRYGIIFMGFKKTESISRLIHEINECELSDLLSRLGVKDVILKVNKWMIKKYPFLFTERREVAVTHIISPFGSRYCLLDRKKNRVFW